MLLIGATRAFVRKPFLAKGFVQGVWGGFIASILVALILLKSNIMIPDFVSFQYIPQIALLLAAIFVFSVLFTVIISLFSVNRYIKINRDELYL
jgi:cell division transport system permease protein